MKTYHIGYIPVSGYVSHNRPNPPNRVQVNQVGQRFGLEIPKQWETQRVAALAVEMPSVVGGERPKRVQEREANDRYAIDTVGTRLSQRARTQDFHFVPASLLLSAQVAHDRLGSAPLIGNESSQHVEDFGHDLSSRAR